MSPAELQYHLASILGSAEVRRAEAGGGLVIVIVAPAEVGRGVAVAQAPPATSYGHMATALIRLGQKIESDARCDCEPCTARRASDAARKAAL